ncbi:MAG: hypothetical protein RBT71_04315 [Flavobacteriales bacterium]|jgi:16S rRNA C967 or C1407 C5-methylase (RsmB/RsmF family)/NOL1/NOP2/fmu family ribosome biogenesis protein|nr:hypothetical protein [Flavobacteriales bacterium]
MPPARAHRPAPGHVPVPVAFGERAATWLADERTELLTALDAPAHTSIRINARKLPGHPGEAVPWCATGRYLARRPVFTLDPLMHAGCYYVQEASSMLLEVAVRASGAMDRDIVALDMCAAPGGKSTHLRSLLTPGSLLVCNEAVPARRPALCENLWKWGWPNVVVSGSAAAHFSALPGLFDLVLVDAPCSGEGMFRKDPFARQQWSPALVAQCARVQRDILAHAWAALAPGGTLVYSTCTWEPEENEDQVRWLFRQGAEPIVLAIPPDWGPVPSEGTGGAAWRAYPHRTRGEGFFIAALRKPGEAVHVRTDHHRPGAAPPAECKKWCATHQDLHTTEQDGTWHVVDTVHADRLRTLGTALTMAAPGVPMAVVKGNSIKPHPAWALNSGLERTAFEVVEADADRTMAYLHGEALRAGPARGTALLTHAGHPIGWLHGAGTRWNNPWPRAWRVRMPHR